MPLKVSSGEMYSWVTHTVTHLGGICPHRCAYCYVDSSRFGRPKRYQGELRLIEDEFKVNYGSGKTIFMENCNDLFANDVPSTMISRVLAHCNTWPGNTYVFQTKNPTRYEQWLQFLPTGCILGTTIETNRQYDENIGKAPAPAVRAEAMAKLANWKKFLTLEPILDFDIKELSAMVLAIKPDFLNIGADSHKRGLPEPTKEKILDLVGELRKGGIEVREKRNLARIMEA